jgi:hypothetical protein
LSVKIKIFTILTLLSVLPCSAQEKTSLQVFNELVDSSVMNLTTFIPDTVKFINIEMNTGTSFEIFNSEIISDLNQEGYKLISDNRAFRIQYLIKNATVDYGNMYRDGILGDYYVSRSVLLSGNFNLTGETTVTHEFNYSSKDTIKADDVKNLENPAYPFTQGKMPAEPFFSGILEPVVAVGTAALAVILFFTIRSK